MLKARTIHGMYGVLMECKVLNVWRIDGLYGVRWNRRLIDTMHGLFTDCKREMTVRILNECTAYCRNVQHIDGMYSVVMGYAVY